MPELPEVETIIRDLRKNGLAGRRIRRAHIFWPRTLATSAPEAFDRDIRNREILQIRRRGKFVVLDLSGPRTLLIHLRMSGRLDLEAADHPHAPYERARLDLDDGRELRFFDPRKFGRWYFYEKESGPLLTLGPEPLDARFNEKLFSERLALRNRRLKALLLDQTFVAGLGNIYVDETLWEAGLHPEKLSGRLKPDEQKKLFAAIREVLQRGIRNCGTSLGNSRFNYYSVGGRRGRNQDQLRVFRRAGAPCLRCKTLIVRLVVAQRGTHICPACQKIGRRRQRLL